MKASPKLFLIAGPNGAGKTTYAFRHIKAVSGSTRFVNLDEISRGLSPLEPTAAANRAARIALTLTHALIRERVSFSIETTLAGSIHLRTIAAARSAGFEIVLLYFPAASPELCLSRIARRVAEGGHDMPEIDVRRRFAHSLQNLSDYAAQATLWRIFDLTRLPVRVAAEGRLGCVEARAGNGLPQVLVEWLDDLPDVADMSTVPPLGARAADSVTTLATT